MRTFKTISIVFFTTLLGAQSVSHLVLNKFGNKERGIWIRQYEGRMDDLSYAYLVLGYNQEVYRGLLQQKGLDDWHLEGEVDGKTLNLIVVNDQDDLLGYIRGQIQDSTIVATFSFHDEAWQRLLVLDRILRPTPSDVCGKNKWLKTYRGTLMSDRADFVLQKEEDQTLSGLVFFENQNISYDLKGNCDTETCDEANLELFNSQDVLLGSLKMSDLNSNSMTVQLGEDIHPDFILTQDLPMICGSHFHKKHRLSYVYPFFENKKIDDWFKRQVNSWLSAFRDPVQSDLEYGDYRLWADLDYLGDRLISGTITSRSKSGQIERESFIFDLSKKAPIEISEWVMDQKDFDQFISEIIQAEKSRTSRNFPPEGQAWLEAQDFSHVSARKEGLCLKSEYSSLFGEKKIMIPWNVVEPYLKRFVNIQKLLK